MTDAWLIPAIKEFGSLAIAAYALVQVNGLSKAINELRIAVADCPKKVQHG